MLKRYMKYRNLCKLVNIKPFNFFAYLYYNKMEVMR